MCLWGSRAWRRGGIRRSDVRGCRTARGGSEAACEQKWNMDEEVAESWEEAADSEVNHERFTVPSVKGDHHTPASNICSQLFVFFFSLFKVRGVVPR